MRTLLNNQQEAINKLKKYKVGALFMQAGSGKTQTAVGLINSRDIEYILWFTPYRTKENLKEEIKKCNLKSTNVEVIGIETLSNSDKTYLYLLEKYKHLKFFCIVDESLKIKNNSKRARRIIEIGHLASYRLILNGTPISKNYLDLYNQMNFLSPKILKMSYQEFYKTFVIEKQILKNKRIIKRYPQSFTNLEYLFQLISPFIFESDLSLDIEISKKEIYYEVSNEEAERYLFYKERLIETFEKFETNIVWIFQKMQLSYSLNTEKIEKIKYLIERDHLTNKDTLIFYKYIQEQEILEKEFKGFKILSLQKHSFGLNLQEYNKIIFFNMSWDYALMDQSIRRIYRLGQNKNCTIYYLLSDLGLDRMIFQNLNKKENLLIELKKLTIKELEEKL